MLVPSGPWQKRRLGLLAVGAVGGATAWVALGNIPAAIVTIGGIGLAGIMGPLASVLALVLGLHAVGVQATAISVVVATATAVFVLVSLPDAYQNRAAVLGTAGGFVLVGTGGVIASAGGFTTLEQATVIVLLGASCSYLLHRVELVRLGYTDESETTTS